MKMDEVVREVPLSDEFPTLQLWSGCGPFQRFLFSVSSAGVLQGHRYLESVILVQEKAFTFT